MRPQPNLLVGIALVSICLAAYSHGQDQSSAPAKSQQQAVAKANVDLSVDQGRLADRFKRLEEVIGRLAELSAGADPRRAELLRQAIAQSRQQELSTRFDSIVNLLEAERLSAAATNQSELQKELDALLTLLLKADRDTTLASERERIRAYLKELGRLLRLERDLRARTEGGDDTKRLADAQKRVADETGKLSSNIHETEGEINPDAKSDAQADAKVDKSGQSSENKSGEGKSSEAKSRDGKSAKGEQKNADDSKGDPSKAKPNDGKSTNRDSKSGQPSEGKSQPGQPSDGDSKNGEPGQSQQSQPGQPSQSGSPSQPGESGDEKQKPQGPPPNPTDRAVERLKRAQQQMEDALKELEKTEREGATERQQEAIESLEVAKAELERVLRQLREEEMDRTLTQLAARFRKMLELQTAIYESTLQVDKIALTDRGHDQEIESARLSRQEAALVREADKALLLLREEGSSVAFPETVEQIRDDMQMVTTRLAAVDVGRVTQDLETDIIASLEESIAALERALKELERNRTPPGQAPMASQPAEPGLVDKLAELKMIRSLQMRINVRTKRFGELIAGEQVASPDLLEALDQLAKRQARVYQATADLSQGRND